MQTKQKMLNLLLDKYSISNTAVLSSCQTVTIDAKNFNLLPHRCKRRFIELKNIVENSLGEISMVKASHTCNNNTDITQILLREIDIAEFITNKKTLEVFAVQNQVSVNANILMQDGIVLTVEIAATLNDFEKPQDKHEVISSRGIACDLVVDTQVKQDSVYVFGDNRQSFTDVDFELYGLDTKDVAIVRNAFLLAKDENVRKEYIAQQKHLEKIKAAIDKSINTLCSVRL